jgi:hypothetical protein
MADARDDKREAPGLLDLLGRLRGPFDPPEDLLHRAIPWLWLRAFGRKQWTRPRKGSVLVLVPQSVDLFLAFGHNESATACYVGIYDRTDVKIPTGYPATMHAYVNALGNWSLALPRGGPTFEFGIVVASSTDPLTYQPPGRPIELTAQAEYLATR